MEKFLRFSCTHKHHFRTYKYDTKFNDTYYDANGLPIFRNWSPPFILLNLLFNLAIYWWRHYDIQLSEIDCLTVMQCSLCNCRLPHVILGPPVLSGMVRRRCSGWPRDLRHNGSHCRIFFRNLPDVQGNRWPLWMDSHHAGVVWWYFVYLLVRSQAFRRSLRPRRKLHVYVAETYFWTNRRTTRQYSRANTITDTRCVTNECHFIASGIFVIFRLVWLTMTAVNKCSTTHHQK